MTTSNQWGGGSKDFQTNSEPFPTKGVFLLPVGGFSSLAWDPEWWTEYKLSGWARLS
jgi:hypothetical protein